MSEVSATKFGSSAPQLETLGETGAAQPTESLAAPSAPTPIAPPRAPDIVREIDTSFVLQETNAAFAVPLIREKFIQKFGHPPSQAVLEDLSLTLAAILVLPVHGGPFPKPLGAYDSQAVSRNAERFADLLVHDYADGQAGRSPKGDDTRNHRGIYQATVRSGLAAGNVIEKDPARQRSRVETLANVAMGARNNAHSWGLIPLDAYDYRGGKPALTAALSEGFWNLMNLATWWNYRRATPLTVENLGRASENASNEELIAADMEQHVVQYTLAGFLSFLPLLGSLIAWPVAKLIMSVDALRPVALYFINDYMKDVQTAQLKASESVHAKT